MHIITAHDDVDNTATHSGTCCGVGAAHIVTLVWSYRNIVIALGTITIAPDNCNSVRFRT